jgi:hypothetical protein
LYEFTIPEEQEISPVGGGGRDPYKRIKTPEDNQNGKGEIELIDSRLFLLVGGGS